MSRSAREFLLVLAVKVKREEGREVCISFKSVRR